MNLDFLSPRTFFLFLIILSLWTFGPTACRKNSENKGTGSQQQDSQQKSPERASDSQASGTEGGPITQPAQSTTGRPSAASDEGNSTATNGLPNTMPGAPTSSQPQPSNEVKQEQPAEPALTVPAGTILAIRLNQRIGVLTSRTGDLFTGRVVSPLPTQGKTTIPAGASIAGVVLHTRRKVLSKGASVLKLTLSGLNVGEQHFQFRTPDSAVSSQHRSTGPEDDENSIGKLLGGAEGNDSVKIFGSLTGTRSGTITASLIGTKDIDYPPDSLLSFQLNTPLSLRP